MRMKNMEKIVLIILMECLLLQFGTLTRKNYFLQEIDLGVKPLFYCSMNGNLMFSSEIKSILQLGRN